MHGRTNCLRLLSINGFEITIVECSLIGAILYQEMTWNPKSYGVYWMQERSYACIQPILPPVRTQN